MSAWTDIINSILGAGTFTNHGSQPTTIILYEGSIRAIGTYIILEDDDEDITQDHKGKVLFKHKTGTLSIFSGKKSARDNIESDIKNILLNSNYSFRIESERPSIPQQDTFKYEMIITILD